MKKRILASMLTAIMTLSFAVGCSSGDGDKSPDEMTTELTEPVTVELWHYLSGGSNDALESVVKDFNTTNTMGITVKSVNQGSISDLNKKVITASQSNSLPAIINVYPDVATGLIEQDKIADLSGYVNDEKVGMKKDFEEDFSKTFVDEVSQWDEGKIYGVPMTKSTEVLYINKNLVEKLGYTVEDVQNLTMDKLVEISKKAKAELGIPGFGFDSSSNAFISTLKMDGKDFVEIDGEINVNNDWVKKYMDFYKENISEGYFRIPGEDMYLSGPFSNQKVLMYQGSSAGATHIKTNGEFEVIVAEVPKFEEKDNAVIQQGASLYVTNDVSSEEKYAAYEFIKFATNTENTAKFAAATGYLPVRKSAADTDIMKEVLADDTSMYAKVYPVAQKSLEYAYFTPAVNNAQSARDIAKEKFESYISGGIDDIDTFIEDTTTQVETSIQRQ